MENQPTTHLISGLSNLRETKGKSFEEKGVVTGPKAPESQVVGGQKKKSIDLNVKEVITDFGKKFQWTV